MVDLKYKNWARLLVKKYSDCKVVFRGTPQSTPYENVNTGKPLENVPLYFFVFFSFFPSYLPLLVGRGGAGPPGSTPGCL